MFFVDFLTALVIALILTGIFVFVFRSKRPWPSLLWFFLIILLSSWAGGVWMYPVGPPVRGISWLSFLIVGLLAALLISAATLPEPRESTVELVDLQEKESERKAAKRVFNIFFWILFALLILVILTRYLV